MDRLVVRLSYHEAHDVGRWPAVDLLVNGNYLKDLVADFERARTYAPVGGYDSINLDGLQPAHDRLTGQPSSWPGDGDVVLLVCESCREEGCWPLFGRVQMGSAVVEWSGLRQPHRPDRDYSELHFRFDRQQYDIVKSRKHEWDEACFIPAADDKSAVEQVVSRFVELQGDDLAGGLAFREFVELDPVGRHPRSGLRLGREYRLLIP